jgi:hypothetical protein
MRWAVGLVVTASLPCLAAAQEVVWRAVARTPDQPAVIASTAPRPAEPAAPATASLGRPVPLVDHRRVATPARCPAPPAPRARSTPLIRAQAGEPEPPDPLLAPILPSSAPPPPELAPGGEGIRPTAGTAPLQPPVPDPVFGTHTAAAPSDPPPPPPPGLPPPDPTPGMAIDQPVGPKWWEKMRGWMRWGDSGSTNGRGCFQSDHCFDCLISPVTQPFYFEDPRALTEVRPIFMYQSIPSATPVIHGGNLYFFGTQARLAFTDQLSLVLNELGFISFDPRNTAPPLIQSGTGFAEVKLGPKWTFLRSTDWGSVAAVGLTFEIPAGDRKVFQNTGQLGLNPYLSYGQTFRLPSGFGALNFLGVMGYDISTDSRRSEFFHMHFHLDYNIASIGLFPLIELNWLHYTKRGTNGSFGTEGADLINLGSSTRRGDDYLSLAVGARYRFSDHIYAGGAVEFPLSHERGLNDFRVTLDLIFRY